MGPRTWRTSLSAIPVDKSLVPGLSVWTEADGNIWQPAGRAAAPPHPDPPGWSVIGGPEEHRVESGSGGWGREHRHSDLKLLGGTQSSWLIPTPQDLPPSPDLPAPPRCGQQYLVSSGDHRRGEDAGG